MYIYLDSFEDMIKACAALVREGVTYKAKHLDGQWRIELTGGY